jgi:hypothetical protein
MDGLAAEGDGSAGLDHSSRCGIAVCSSSTVALSASRFLELSHARILFLIIDRLPPANERAVVDVSFR